MTKAVSNLDICFIKAVENTCTFQKISRRTAQLAPPPIMAKL